MLLDKYDVTRMHDLATAVVCVQDEWDAQDKRPGSDDWTIRTRDYRPQMIEAVTAKWSIVTGHDPEQFPFHDDFVCRIWVAYRKGNPADKQELRECLGVESATPAMA